MNVLPLTVLGRGRDYPHGLRAPKAREAGRSQAAGCNSLKINRLRAKKVAPTAGWLRVFGRKIDLDQGTSTLLAPFGGVCAAHANNGRGSQAVTRATNFGVFCSLSANSFLGNDFSGGGSPIFQAFSEGVPRRAVAADFFQNFNF